MTPDADSIAEATFSLEMNRNISPTGLRIICWRLSDLRSRANETPRNSTGPGLHFRDSM